MTRQLGVPFAVASPSAHGRRRQQLTASAHAGLDEARRLLGAPPGDVTDGGSLTEAIADLSSQLAAGLRDASVPAGAGAAAIAELQRVGLALHEHAADLRAQRLAHCEHLLTRLRTMPTAQGLVDRVCDELVRHCGFGRAVLSRVDGKVWRPWKLSETEPSMAWFEQWTDREITLEDTMLETRLLHERRAELVGHTGGPEIHDIVRSGMSTSYVVAPIVPAGHVIGFLHADHHPQDRRCDVADRDVLWRLAEGFGHLYMRAALVERLSVQREQVHDTLRTLAAAMTDLTDSEIAMASYDEAGTAAASRGVVSTTQGTRIRLDQLTPREAEVMLLIVAGASNQAIADELVIAVGTAKSHVKQILAKLGVRNRSQAIALYYGATP